MRIGINASFLRKTDTGMGQVSRGFISELVKSYSDKNEYFLYLEKDIDFKLPKNFHKRIFLPAWKRDDLIRKIWWEKFLLLTERCIFEKTAKPVWTCIVLPKVIW